MRILAGGVVLALCIGSALAECVPARVSPMGDCQACNNSPGLLALPATWQSGAFPSNRLACLTENCGIGSFNDGLAPVIFEQLWVDSGCHVEMSTTSDVVIEREMVVSGKMTLGGDPPNGILSVADGANVTFASGSELACVTECIFGPSSGDSGTGTVVFENGVSLTPLNRYKSLNVVYRTATVPRFDTEGGSVRIEGTAETLGWNGIGGAVVIAEAASVSLSTPGPVFDGTTLTVEKDATLSLQQQSTFSSVDMTVSGTLRVFADTTFDSGCWLTVDGSDADFRINGPMDWTGPPVTVRGGRIRGSSDTYPLEIVLDEVGGMVVGDSISGVAGISLALDTLTAHATCTSCILAVIPHASSPSYLSLSVLDLQGDLIVQIGLGDMLPGNEIEWSPVSSSSIIGPGSVQAAMTPAAANQCFFADAFIRNADELVVQLSCIDHCSVMGCGPGFVCENRFGQRVCVGQGEDDDEDEGGDGDENEDDNNQGESLSPLVLGGGGLLLLLGAVGLAALVSRKPSSSRATPRRLASKSDSQSDLLSENPSELLSRAQGTGLRPGLVSEAAGPAAGPTDDDDMTSIGSSVSGISSFTFSSAGTSSDFYGH